MTEWITDYVLSRDEWRHNKFVQHKHCGLLQSLETPYPPWMTISTDFVDTIWNLEGSPRSV